LIRSDQAGHFFLPVHPPETRVLRTNIFRSGATTANNFFYGIPGSDRPRLQRWADDTRGEAFDPTNGERVVSPTTLKRIREYVASRFPAMKNAPLIETRVCQYEQTSDSSFILGSPSANG